jgi:hypothetical protein
MQQGTGTERRWWNRFLFGIIVASPFAVACGPDSAAGTTPEAATPEANDAGAKDAAPDHHDASSDAAHDATRDAGRSVAVTAPRHVLTMDYGDGYVPVQGTYPISAYPWLSLVQIQDVESAKAFRANGVKTVYYTFATQVVGGSGFWSKLGGETWSAGASPTVDTFLHDCAGHALAGPTEGHYSWYFIDWSQSATVEAYEAYYVDNNINNFDYWFIDGEETTGGMADVVTKKAEPPCQSGTALSDTSYLSQLATGLDKLGVPVLVNGLSDTLYETGEPCSCLSVAEAVKGARMEATYICPGNGEGGCANQAPSGAGFEVSHDHPLWQSKETTEMDMAKEHKVLMIQGYDNNVDPATDTGRTHRLFYWASFFLTYDLGSTVAWYGAYGFGKDTLATNPSGVRVYPESQVVMLNPTNPEPGTIGALESSGSYGREYRDCFIAGKRIGSCVSAVNPDETSPHPFPLAGYGSSNPHAHVLVLHNGSGTTPGTNGAETINGGFVTADGGPAPADLLSDTGVIVFDTSR